MSSIFRAWRSFKSAYEIDEYPLTFVILSIQSISTIIGLITYTYFVNPPARSEWKSAGDHWPIYTSIYSENNQYDRYYSINQSWTSTQAIYQSIASQFTAVFASEWILGSLIAWYCMKPLEPMLGRNMAIKILSVIVIIAFNGLIDSLIVTFTNQSTLQSGLYWLFSLLPFYIVNQSINQSIKIGPLKLNDKHFVYFLFLLFLFPRVPQSLINSSIGLLIGCFYLLIRWLIAGGFDRLIDQSINQRRGMIIGSADQSINLSNAPEMHMYQPAATPESINQPSISPPISQSLNQPINQSANQSRNPRPTNQYEKLLANATKGSRTQPVNQSTNQSVNRSANPPAASRSSSVNQPTIQTNNPSINRSSSQPNEVRNEELLVSIHTQHTDQSIYQSFPHLVKTPTINQSINQSVNWFKNQSIDQSSTPTSATVISHLGSFSLID